MHHNVLLPIITKNGTTPRSPFINCQPSSPGQQVFWFKGARLLNYPGTDQVSHIDTSGQANLTQFVFNTNSSFNGTYHCFGKEMHRTFDVSYCKSIIYIFKSTMDLNIDIYRDCYINYFNNLSQRCMNFNSKNLAFTSYIRHIIIDVFLLRVFPRREINAI